MNKLFASVVAGLACVFSVPAQSAREQSRTPDAQHRIVELLEQQRAVLQEIKALLERHDGRAAGVDVGDLHRHLVATLGDAKHGEHDLLVKKPGQQVVVTRGGEQCCCACCGEHAKSKAKEECEGCDEQAEAKEKGKEKGKEKVRTKVEVKSKQPAVVLRSGDGQTMHGFKKLELGGKDSPHTIVFRDGEAGDLHGFRKVELDGKSLPHTIMLRGEDGKELSGAHVIELGGKEGLLPMGGAIQLEVDGDGKVTHRVKKLDGDGKAGAWKVLMPSKAKKGGEDQDDDDDDDQHKVETKRIEVAPAPATPKKPKKTGVGLRVV